MNTESLNIFLADDDKDDSILFKEILDELPLNTNLKCMYNGEQLMQALKTKTQSFPHAIFLDLNMPRKNGQECLTQLKQNETLTHIPIIIYSTSYDPYVAKELFALGAHFYIRKPCEFGELKKVIHRVLELIIADPQLKPSEKTFLLNSKIKTH